MPGVIMENGSRNGLHTNHERDQRPNGINGAHQQSEKVQDRQKGRFEPLQNVTPTSPSLPNGVNGRFPDTPKQRTSNGDDKPSGSQNPLDELPPEIAHITEGYIPLSGLLGRLAQKTSNDLTVTINELAEMPAPTSTANGYRSSGIDDTSQENLNKKLRLIKFLEDAHGDWAKLLAITEWSRNADKMSKLIDLQQHLRMRKQYFNQSIDTLCEYKRGLLGARLPNPDLRTALEVLTTGKVSWMPDLGYIPPPALTASEILKTLENLNTLLSIRMNIHEYDKLPCHFQDYSISSGRVTFKVAGEFEVDLAIASEDPEVQFWFIDLRFTFSPQPADMDANLRFLLEQKINEVLSREGLSGCYKYLHEMVLTRKILEIRRQTAELARGRWIDGLKIEPLNRALSIQYWVDRYSKGPKSWILLGVHSGKPDHGRFGSKATSRLSIRWFRDGKEVNDEKLTFDMVNLSAEELLKAVTARHASHILTSIYKAMRSHDLFSHQILTIRLNTSSVDPADAMLDIRLTHTLRVSIKIEAATGRFVFSPASQRVIDFENRLNSLSSDPAKDANGYLESLRYVSLVDEIHRHGSSVGWTRVVNPGFGNDTLKSIMPKETAHMAWFRRPSWPKNWVLAVSFSMKGERWWLMQSEEMPKDPKSFKESKDKDAKAQIPRKVTKTIQIPIRPVSAIPTYNFMLTLNIFVAALLSGFSNIQSLQLQHVSPVLRRSQNLSKGIVLPSIYARLSELLPSKNISPRTKQPWARDIVRITFQGLEVMPLASPLAPEGISSPKQLKQINAAEESTLVVSEARMVVPLSTSMTGLNELADRDIAWHAPSGTIAFKIRSQIGESIVQPLVERAIRVERLVDYVKVLQTHEKTLKRESIALGKISFSYATRPLEDQKFLAEIDFEVAKDIKLELKTGGDPLVRIVDFLTMVLNDSEHGFNAVARYMPLTLPLLRGLDAMESSWDDLSADEDKHCYVLARAVDWYIIRFNFTQPPVAGSETVPTLRKVTFEARLKPRKGEPFWHIQRTDIQDPAAPDDLDVALKSIWNASDETWFGMRLSAVAAPAAVESLLSKLDSVVRDVASSPISVPAAAPSAVVSNPVQAAPKATPRPQSTNQQRQQSNQRQPSNQNQARMNPNKVIQID